MKYYSVLISLMLFMSSALADVSKGRKLHDDNCMKCHDDGVYTREDRSVRNRQALRTQVQRCELNLGLRWFDEQIDDVTTYLDQTYYKFK